MIIRPIVNNTKSKVVMAWMLVTTLFSLTSCHVERPHDVLSDSKMEAVLYDYHFAKVMGESYSAKDRYKRELLFEAVYEKHHITKAEFDSTMVWYSRNPEALEKIYQRLQQRIKNDYDAINRVVAERGDRNADRNLSGDTVDIWNQSAIQLLEDNAYQNLLTFHLTPDSTYRPTDRMTLNMRFRYAQSLIPEESAWPYVAFQVQYARKDTVLFQYLKVPSLHRLYSLTIEADSLDDIRDISGYVYIPVQYKGTQLTIDQISLMRYHRNVETTTTENQSVEVAKPAPVPEEPQMRTPARPTTEQLKASQKSHNPTPSLPAPPKRKHNQRPVRRIAH